MLYCMKEHFSHNESFSFEERINTKLLVSKPFTSNYLFGLAPLLKITQISLKVIGIFNQDKPVFKNWLFHILEKKECSKKSNLTPLSL